MLKQQYIAQDVEHMQCSNQCVMVCIVIHNVAACATIQIVMFVVIAAAAWWTSQFVMIIDSRSDSTCDGCRASNRFSL